MFFLKSLFLDQSQLSFKAVPLHQKLAILSLCLLPVFHLTFRGWTGNFRALSALLCFISLCLNPQVISQLWQETRVKWMIVCLVAYPLTIFLSQLCRWSFHHHDYLDTSPFLYFIPVLFFIVWQKIDLGKWLQLALPLLILGAFCSCFIFFPELKLKAVGGPERLAPYFIDPLAFGQSILTCGLMCLVGIEFQKRDLQKLLLSLWSFLGFCIGIYLSIRSGSRTGWMSIPFIFLFLLTVKFHWHWVKSITISLLLSTVACTVIYLLFPLMQERILLAWHEITSYPWHGGIAPDTSVGLRITFQRLGWFYFSQSPLYGWGTSGYLAIKDAPEILSFSSQYARDFVFNALFHNELMTQLVRYGMLGALGYLCVVFIPLGIALRHLRSQNAIVIRCSVLCIVFLTCQIISGLSDEFLNLKLMVTFYAFIVSVLIGSIIAFSQAPVGEAK